MVLYFFCRLFFRPHRAKNNLQRQEIHGLRKS
jgi:hypothetical protein